MDLVFSKKMKDIDGNLIDLSYLNKEVVLVVNTASKCGFTKQLRGLGLIEDRFKRNGFSVVACPSNNFKNQEPLTNEEIAKTYRNVYEVKYLITEKINVVENPIDPLYEDLFKRSGNRPEWNFSKYLVNRGRDVFYFAHDVGVDDLIARIQATL